MCSNKDQRLDEAKTCFERAANNFKLEKKWFEAGECYEKCANIEEQTGQDPSTSLEEAAHCFKFTDKKRTLQNINKCVSHYEKNGRFSAAGDARKKLAENYENDLEYKLAIEEYRKAADYYEMEKSNSKNSQQGCLLKAADLMLMTNHPDAFDVAKNVNLFFIYKYIFYIYF
jgi:alpha-soluble NSF attachment protein